MTSLLAPLRFQVSEKRQLVIDASCLAKLWAHAQRTPGATEAGGLLLGRLSDENTCLTLCEATGPYPGDVRERFGFAREDPEHQAAVKRHWKDSGGEVACWADWHTHAEPHPEPSALDAESWRADFESLGDHFAVIVGTESIGVWEVTREGNTKLTAQPCPGIEIEPGKHSGCTAAQTGAKDCPTCGPRVTCAHCGATALEGEAEGWRSLTCHDATHQMVCPECQKGLEGLDRSPNP